MERAGAYITPHPAGAAAVAAVFALRSAVGASGRVGWADAHPCRDGVFGGQREDCLPELRDGAQVREQMLLIEQLYFYRFAL